MKVRFLADENLDQNIIAGVLRREPDVDFEFPQDCIPEGMEDPDVLALASSLGRVLVTHDVRTMPRYFADFIIHHECAGLIVIPQRIPIAQAIEELLLIWHLSEPSEWRNLLRRLPL